MNNRLQNSWTLWNFIYLQYISPKLINGDLVELEPTSQLFDQVSWLCERNNADFYNWNRVKIRYCDGASFAGDAKFENGVGQLLLPPFHSNRFLFLLDVT